MGRWSWAVDSRMFFLFLPHQEIRISLNATDALQPLHLVIYWGIITLSLTFSLDNKSNGNHQNPPLSTGFQFSSVQSLGCVQLFAALWAAACQASLSITNSWSLLTHVHWVSDAIQPSHALLSPSPPAFNLSQHQCLFQWVSSSQQVAKIFSINPFSEYSGLISFRNDCFDLLAVQGTLKNLLQHHSSKASIV